MKKCHITRLDFRSLLHVLSEGVRDERREIMEVNCELK